VVGTTIIWKVSHKWKINPELGIFIRDIVLQKFCNCCSVENFRCIPESFVCYGDWLSNYYFQCPWFIIWWDLRGSWCCRYLSCTMFDLDVFQMKLPVEVSPTLVEQVKSLTSPASGSPVESHNAVEILVGTSCKNGGCKQSYGTENAETSCTHHPGYPVFHEGLKFWSCCQRRTTDFDSFLEQEGCVVGKHVWVKDKVQKIH